MTRLPPITAEEWGDQERKAVSYLMPEGRRERADVGAALAQLVRHPALARRFLTFNTHLLIHSTLPARLRELAILRVARRRDCAFEWVHHTQLALENGLTQEEIDAAGRGEAADPLDAAVLRAVDELDDTSNLSDATWSALGAHLSEHQLMDLVFTIGAYCLLAMAFNTFGLDPDIHH
ncbi:carboxymuconolactone decarboxylase family protein [Actinocorallia aurea]